MVTYLWTRYMRKIVTSCTYTTFYFLTGEITFRHLLTSMPFGNDIVAVTVNGTTLKSAFENSALSKSDTAMSGRFLQHSGGFKKAKFLA